MTTLRIDRHDHLMILTIDDPATRNALSGEELFGGLEEAVRQANAHVDVRALILTGAGAAFSSGGNVREMRDRTGMFAGSGADITRQYRGGIQRIPRALASLDVPIIAAVNGAAVGAGFDLVCMCDIAIASDRATFAQSFVKVGLIPGDGGAWLVPRLIGWSRAAEMAFTGDTIDASTAAAWGVVSRVVPHETLMMEARALGERIAANAPQAVRGTKRLMREARHSSLDASLDAAALRQAQAHDSADHREALSALFEKRRARFSGS